MSLVLKIELTLQKELLRNVEKLLGTIFQFSFAYQILKVMILLQN